MSAETQKVLEMVAAGKISPADADRLLQKLSHTNPNPEPPAPAEPPAGKSGKKFLRILVDKPGRDAVNIRVPLSFLRSGMAWTVMPKAVRERLEERGINLSRFISLRELGSMDAEQLEAVLEQLNMEIDKGDGKKVRIFAE
ncbi:MAG TPA: hypothetical protein VFU76_13660 [Terriglobales bacterium]|nr:hypothetical protein [Terriglobales bacterium]